MSFLPDLRLKRARVARQYIDFNRVFTEGERLWIT